MLQCKSTREKTVHGAEYPGSAVKVSVDVVFYIYQRQPVMPCYDAGVFREHSVRYGRLFVYRVQVIRRSSARQQEVTVIVSKMSQPLSSGSVISSVAREGIKRIHAAGG